MNSRINRPPEAFAGQPKPVDPHKDEAYLKWLRGQPCIVRGVITGDVIAHHVRLERAADGSLRGYGQLGKRVPDRQCVPLSSHLHDGYPHSLHSWNEADWWRKRNLDPLIAAQVLYAIYTEKPRMAIVEQSVAAIKRLAAA